MSSLFVSMSFATSLEYSVVNVGMEDNQSAVMMCNEHITVSKRFPLLVHADVIPSLGSY